MLVPAKLPTTSRCPECRVLRAVSSLSHCELHKAKQALYRANRLLGTNYVIAEERDE